MNKFPSAIQLELQENEVREDINTILDAMHKIKTEAHANAVNKKAGSLQDLCDDKTKDEYLHLTYRLASAIKGISDDLLDSRMKKVVDCMEKDARLIRYDYCQEEYWKDENKEFSRTLDKVVISALGDRISSFEAKHHTLQAVKFLASADSSPEEKERIYATILPFNGAVPFENKNSFSQVLKRFIGYSYHAESDNGMCIKVKGEKKFLEDVFKEAKKMGYLSLESMMSTDDYNQLKNKYRAEVVDAKKEDMNESIRNFLSKTAEHSKFLLYPVLGTLSHKLRSRLEDYLGSDSFDAEKASACSFLMELAGGFVMMGLGQGLHSFALFTIGVSFLASFFFRLIIGANREDLFYSGSLQGQLISLPFEYITFKHNGDNICARIKLDEKSPEKKIVDANTFFKQLAEFTFSKDVENNLEYSTKNHHQYAKLFTSAIDKKVKKTIPPFSPDYEIDKENQVVSISRKIQIGDYKKEEMIAFLKNQRYLISTINSASISYQPKSLHNILASGISEEEKAAAITKDLNADYVHLLKFEEGKKVADYEVTS